MLAVAPDDTRAPVLERRSFERFAVIAPGRYSFDGGPEHNCVTDNVSAEGVALRGLSVPRVGANVVCDIRNVGRVFGRNVRPTEAGFVMSIEASATPLNLIASRLKQLAADQTMSSAPLRVAERVVPDCNDTHLTVEDGRTYKAKILNLSQTGIAISAPVRPEVDSLIIAGRLRARVVRHFHDGIGAVFLVPLSYEQVRASFSTDVQGS